MRPSPILSSWLNGGDFEKDRECREEEQAFKKRNRKRINSGLTTFYLKCLSLIQVKMSCGHLGYQLKVRETWVGDVDIGKHEKLLTLIHEKQRVML